MAMQRWTVCLEGGPRRVNHAAVAIEHKIYSFGGYCTGDDFENTRPMDIHILNCGWLCDENHIIYMAFISCLSNSYC